MTGREKLAAMLAIVSIGVAPAAVHWAAQHWQAIVAVVVVLVVVGWAVLGGAADALNDALRDRNERKDGWR